MESYNDKEDYSWAKENEFLIYLALGVACTLVSAFLIFGWIGVRAVGGIVFALLAWLFLQVFADIIKEGEEEE